MTQLPYRSDGKIAVALAAHFEEKPQQDKELLTQCIYHLTGVKGIGRLTAIEILWSIGRKLVLSTDEGMQDVNRP